MTKIIKKLSINDLLIDHENARFGGSIVESQIEAIEYMLSIKGMDAKIYRLIDHIAGHGTDPSELPLVVPHEGKYIVMEGNRRVLAIKLIRNPNLFKSDVFRRRIEKLTSTQLKRSLSKIQCSILNSRAEADVWLELKHTGENEGAGRVVWDGQASDAFRLRKGNKKTAGRQIIDYIRADDDFSSDLKNRIDSVDITSLTRLFQGTPAKNAFGLKQTKGILQSLTPVTEFRLALQKVIELMLDEGFSVKDIYHKKDQEKFINNHFSTDDLPSKGNRLDAKQVWGISSLDYDSLTSEQKEGKKPRSTAKHVPKKKKPKQSSKNRKYLIDFPLSIPQKRTNDIYIELRKRLIVQETPNAVAVSFRVFLELTSDYYIEQYAPVRPDNSKKLTIDNTLRHKIEGIVKDLESRDKLNTRESKALMKRCSSHNELISVDAMNKYVHCFDSTPIPSELNILMDNWANFFKAVWN